MAPETNLADWLVCWIFFAQVIDTYDTNNNKAVDLVYLDFQKAFEKVPHEGLMVKVNAMAFKVMQPDGSETGWLVVANRYASTNPIATGNSHILCTTR